MVTSKKILYSKLVIYYVKILLTLSKQFMQGRVFAKFENCIYENMGRVKITQNRMGIFLTSSIGGVPRNLAG